MKRIKASPLSPKKKTKTPATTNDFKTSTTAIEAASDTSSYIGLGLLPNLTSLSMGLGLLPNLT